MTKLQNFQKAYNELIDGFRIKYYWEDSYVEMGYIEPDEKGYLLPIEINDEFWSISDIYQIMHIDFPVDLITKYYYYAFDCHIKKENPITPYNYMHYRDQLLNK